MSQALKTEKAHTKKPNSSNDKDEEETRKCDDA